MLKILVLLSLLITPALANTAEHWQGSNFIIRSFLEIALKNEFDRNPAKLRKWKRPLFVWLDHKHTTAKDKALHTKLVGMHLDHLEDLTGQYIGLVDDPKKANLKVIFTNVKEWEFEVKKHMGANVSPVALKAVCMAGINTNAKSEIYQAVVVIPVDQAKQHRKLVTCIVEELTQVMGLPNDSEKVYPSIFNDKTPNDLLTGLDGLLLKILYRPELKVGMSVGEVIPILRDVVAELQINGAVDNATREVSKGKLYPLMGF